MRILLATYWYLPHVGGVSTYVYGLKKELEKLGHEVDIFAHHPDMAKYYMPNNGRFLEKPKVKDPIYAKVLKYYDKNVPQVEPWIRWREIERYSFEAAALVFGLSRYDLIHTQDIVSTRALWRVKPKQTPLLSTIHGCLATEHIHSGDVKGKDTLAWHYVAREEYYGATSSNLTIVPTHWLKNVLANDFRVPPGHMTVVPYGMDIEAFEKKMEKKIKHYPKTQKTNLICPARLVPVKGHKYLLDALSLLKQERNDWIMWLVGDGPLREQLQQQSKQLNLEENVSFLGDRDDVPALLKEADVFILPSLQDNLPFSIMEAQVAGKPVIVSNAGGIPEMVKHGKTGLISPAGNSEQLFKTIKQLLEDDSLKERLSAQGKKWALTQWSMNTMVDRTLEISQQVIKASKEGFR